MINLNSQNIDTPILGANRGRISEASQGEV